MRVACESCSTGQNIVRNPRCPLCGGVAAEPLPYPGGSGRAPGLRFESIARCSGCGLGYALPQHTQAELDAFYAGGGYWHEVVTHSPQQVAHERNQCRQRVAAVMPHLRAGDSLKVLDIGAGHGWTADALAEALPTALLRFDFIEPDDRLSEAILARCTGFPAARRRSVDDADGPYDLIFLNHVLEHVADPVGFLSGIRARLKPGVVLYIETPHEDYRFKSDVFPHTLFFDPASLSRSLLQAGFVVERCEAFGRWPLARAGALAWLSRVAYRAAIVCGHDGLQNFFDDRVWDYRARADGMWLRCIARNG